MAEDDEVDLYAENLDKDFSGQNKEKFDLYEAIGGPTESTAITATSTATKSDNESESANPNTIVQAVTASGTAMNQQFSNESENSNPNTTIQDGSAAATSSVVTTIPNVVTTGSVGTGTATRVVTTSSTGPASSLSKLVITNQATGSLAPTPITRRFQLYVGNLTWWTTDQDIANAMHDIGVLDFQEVKFFENRVNGQSKGFGVVSLGSEASLHMVMARLPKKQLHGKMPLVTYPTKYALNHFESLQKTRSVPPLQQNGPPRIPIPGNAMPSGLMMPHPVGPQGIPSGHQPRIMNPNMPSGQYRPPHMPQAPNLGPNMQHPGIPQGGGMMPQQGMQGPPCFSQQQPQWVGQQYPNGPRPALLNGPPQMFQGPTGMQLHEPRPDWRPPLHGSFPPQLPQGPFLVQALPRGPSGGPPVGVGALGILPPGNPGAPAPHVSPALFNQSNNGPPQHSVGPAANPVPLIIPISNGPQGFNMPPQCGTRPHFEQQPNGPQGPWQGQPSPVKPEVSLSEQSKAPDPQKNKVEFEEIMGRNRTVSSSAIARAVSDAAAGEYCSAVETLVTAISLIKQSKAAQDERCKILISSLQDTLHGIETKNYNKRERSRSRERSHRQRPRRERSSSHYQERHRDRDRDRRRNRNQDSGYRKRSRSRSRKRDRPSGGVSSGSDHYRDDYRGDHYRDDSCSRSTRTRKSGETPTETAGELPSNRSCYEERYRSSDRECEKYRERHRDRNCERDRERYRKHRSRH